MAGRIQRDRTQTAWVPYYESIADLVRSEKLESGTFVEVGIAWTGLSGHMLRSFPDLIYHSVDPFLSGYDEGDGMSHAWKSDQLRLNLTKATYSRLRAAASEYILLIDAEPCPGRFNFHHRTSSSAAATFLRESVDIVFIDGLHTKEGVESDIESWLYVVKPGGLLLFNDVGVPDFPGVKSSVEELAIRLSSHVVDIGHSNVYIRRPRTL
jgi:hypothetical protein